jgi:hypothetical protein
MQPARQVTAAIDCGLYQCGNFGQFSAQPAVFDSDLLCQGTDQESHSSKPLAEIVMQILTDSLPFALDRRQQISFQPSALTNFAFDRR